MIRSVRDDDIMYPTDAPADLVPVQVHGVGNCLTTTTEFFLFVSVNVGAILWRAKRAQGSPSEESEGKLLDNRRVVNSSVPTPSWHVHVRVRNLAKKKRGFPAVPKGGLQTSAETYMITEKVKQYTCICRAAFLSMRSMGHNKQKRKRKEKEIKTTTKKKRR